MEISKIRCPNSLQDAPYGLYSRSEDTGTFPAQQAKERGAGKECYVRSEDVDDYVSDSPRLKQEASVCVGNYQFCKFQFNKRHGDVGGVDVMAQITATTNNLGGALNYSAGPVWFDSEERYDGVGIEDKESFSRFADGNGFFRMGSQVYMSVGGMVAEGSRGVTTVEAGLKPVTVDVDRFRLSLMAGGRATSEDVKHWVVGTELSFFPTKGITYWSSFLLTAQVTANPVDMSGVVVGVGAGVGF